MSVMLFLRLPAMFVARIRTVILPFYSLGVSNVDSGNTIADNDCDDSRDGNNDDGMIDRLETCCSAAGGGIVHVM